MNLLYLLRGLVFVFCLQVTDGELDEYSNYSPDYSNEKALLELLNNRSVRIELGVPIDRYRKIQKLQADTMNEKNRILSSIGVGNIKLELALYDEVDVKTNDAVRTLLSADQIARLLQIPHHVEIAYTGIARAFADGKLGRLIGVTENQRSALLEKATRYHATAMAQIANLEQAYQNAVVNALSEAHATRLHELLGINFEVVDPALFMTNSRYEDAIEEWKSLDAKGLKDSTVVKPSKTVRDFGNRAELLGLVHRPSVQRELDLSQEQLIAFEELVVGFSEKLNKERKAIIGDRNPNDATVKADLTAKWKAIIVKHSEDFTSIVDELLLPNQFTRLEEIGRHCEIDHMGLFGALESGHLGKEVGVTDTERQKLRFGASKAQETLDLERHRINKSLQAQVISELSTEQQGKAHKLLGSYFEFKDSGLFSHKQRVAEEKQKVTKRVAPK